MKIITWSQAKKRGLKHYYTGKPCVRNHISKRLTSSTTCCQCVRENHYTYYKKHKKKALKSITRWSKRNKKKVNKINKRYQKNNANQASESHKKYRRKNKVKIARKAKQWRKKNPVRLRLYNVKRRKQIKNATPIWANLNDIKLIYECAINKQTSTGKPYHVDHIIPLHHKLVCGLHVAENLQIIPGPDNMEKGNKFEIE